MTLHLQPVSAAGGVSELPGTDPFVAAENTLPH